jgi:hypothetical protein
VQKWEYAVILGISAEPGAGSMASWVATFHTHDPRFYRLTAHGAELVTDFKKRPTGVSEVDAVGQLIAPLGDEGWEMVGSMGDTVWFKRLKP